eukprot:1344040-Amorphochlora_amoeboformis.AAC.1
MKRVRPATRASFRIFISCARDWDGGPGRVKAWRGDEGTDRCKAVGYESGGGGADAQLTITSGLPFSI